MSRKGQHWVTQQLRRALVDLAYMPEADLANDTRAEASDPMPEEPRRPRRISGRRDLDEGGAEHANPG